jgi:hypothetical protein
MVCIFWLVAIAFTVATAIAISSGTWRTSPNLFLPLLIASIAWTLSASYETWFDFIYDPNHKLSIRLDLLLIILGLTVTTVVCVAWIAWSLLLRRSRSRRGTL